jgi:hypothetical protein
MLAQLKTAVVTTVQEITVQIDQSSYIETILKRYLGLPETLSQASPSVIRLTCGLYQWRITLETVEAALLLASVRRLFRDPSLPPLPPIRSLNYFLPVLSEISVNPLPEGYLHYLRYKLESHAARNRTSI